MTIHVENLKFQCIIGILDFERTAPQDVIINLHINYDYKEDFIDYAKVVAFIKEIMLKSEFLLIEDEEHPCPQGRVLPPFPDKKEDALILVKRKSTIGSL